MLFKMKNGLDLNLSCKKSTSLKYLACNILVIKDSGYWIIRRLYLAIKAWLKLAKSLNPRPPLPFAWHSLSYFAQWILFWSFFSPHWNLEITFWISSNKIVGSLKTLIVYVGTAWVVTLIKISLSSLENNLL